MRPMRLALAAGCVSALLWWDAGTLADLAAWRAERIKQGAAGRNPFVCSVQAVQAHRALLQYSMIGIPLT